jgi:hypothetical protein
MKRLLPLALLAALALAGSATPSFAGTFGLFYSHCCCNNCNLTLRPYNAFTPVCCGGGEVVGPNCCSHKWFNHCSKADKKCFPPVYCCPFIGVPVHKHGCHICLEDGTPVPGAPAISESPMPAPTGMAGYLPSPAPAGMMPYAAVQPASYQPALYPPAYAAYPAYPMGYAPIWGAYPMPAPYPAPDAAYYGYPMGR